MAAKKRQSAEIRRHDIIEAAMELIRHEGVSKLTTRSLAKAVGIAQPTLFLHFGNKSHVLVALVDSIQEGLRQELMSLALNQMTPLEQIKTVVRTHLNFIQNQPGIPRLLFSEELQSGDPIFRERMDQLVMFFLKFISGMISAAQEAGEIRADIIPQQAACLLIASIQGLALRWVLTGGERFDLSEQTGIVTTTLLEGWTPR
ncbi:MAG: TetR/AcrR family transcriptional regulator [Gammaproteobacteria bacterium]|nr:TetR/AcrR family transcriptional regulator [Gammaproteobacteria bacterium]MBU1732874.1 TetR/AcrR family transcriptional regulator [Gammaproteobacteria bacterium]MBU1893178.1 TetR/AcrR family transcriptional regulator [Gammaproteobacteria bacterium]